MKTYVITLSQHFPSTHKRKGEATNFEDKFRRQIKLHTIRANYELWEKRFQKIKAQEACLSVRQWTGAPYRSKQVEIARLTIRDGIGIQKMLINESVSYPLISPRMSSTPVSWIKLAFYDGLSLEDWKDWFRNYNLSKPLAIIHFTKFRY